MSVPMVESCGSMLRLTWEPERLVAEVTRVNSNGDGATKAELRLLTTKMGFSPHLFFGQVNLSGINARTTLEKVLSRRYELPADLGTDWDDILEQLVVKTIEWHRTGEEAEEIWTLDDPEPPKMLVGPIWPERYPAIIFGPGGVLKSYLALVLATVVNLPWHDNEIGLVAPAERSPVLYLNWETDRRDIQYRLSSLQAGFGLPHYSLYHRNCRRPLHEDIDAIQSQILKTEAQAIIIDSIALASGGDLNATEAAQRLMGHIRELGVSALLIGHTAKGERGEKTTFGSVFFTNLARSVWEVRKVQQPGMKTLGVALYHKKVNISELKPSLGFRFDFSQPNRVKVTRLEVSEDEELAKGLTLGERIRRVLEKAPNARMSAAQIATILGTGETVIRSTCYRMKDAGILTRVGQGEWGLVARGRADECEEASEYAKDY
ncbi:MAG: AAA family ATPase [Chloroflexota bacterium]